MASSEPVDMGSQSMTSSYSILTVSRLIQPLQAFRNTDARGSP
jgi:hypothetical protein